MSQMKCVVRVVFCGSFFVSFIISVYMYDKTFICVYVVVTT